MNYEIHIGEVYNLENKRMEPQQIIIITEEQRQVIEYFADTKKTEDLQTIYRLNNCRFKVVPSFQQHC